MEIIYTHQIPNNGRCHIKQTSFGLWFVYGQSCNYLPFDTKKQRANTLYGATGLWVIKKGKMVQTKLEYKNLWFNAEEARFPIFTPDAVFLIAKLIKKKNMDASRNFCVKINKNWFFSYFFLLRDNLLSEIRYKILSLVLQLQLCEYDMKDTKFPFAELTNAMEFEITQAYVLNDVPSPKDIVYEIFY
jgi:hypothetical protein